MSGHSGENPTVTNAGATGDYALGTLRSTALPTSRVENTSIAWDPNVAERGMAVDGIVGDDNAMCEGFSATPNTNFSCAPLNSKRVEAIAQRSPTPSKTRAIRFDAFSPLDAQIALPAQWSALERIRSARHPFGAVEAWRALRTCIDVRYRRRNVSNVSMYRTYVR